MATVTVCYMTVSPQTIGVADTLQVRAVTYENGGQGKSSLSLPPIADSVQLGWRPGTTSAGKSSWDTGDIKSAMQHNAITLRSKKVDLVLSGAVGLLLGYQSGQAGGQPAAVAHQRAPK